MQRTYTRSYIGLVSPYCLLLLRYCISTYFPKFKGHVTLNAPPHEIYLLFTFNLQTKYEMSSFTHFKDMAWTPKYTNGLHPGHAPFRYDLLSAGWDLLYNQTKYTIFEVTN